MPVPTSSVASSGSSPTISYYHRNAIVAAVATALTICSREEFPSRDGAIYTACDYEVRLLMKCNTPEELIDKANAKLRQIYSVYPAAAVFFQPLSLRTIHPDPSRTPSVGNQMLRRVLEINAIEKLWVDANREALTRVLRNRASMESNVMVDGFPLIFILNIIQRTLGPDGGLAGDVRTIKHYLMKYVDSRETRNPVAAAPTSSSDEPREAVSTAAVSVPASVPAQPETPSLIDIARYIRSFLSDARIDAMRQHVMLNQGESSGVLRDDLILLDRYLTAALGVLQGNVLTNREGSLRHELSIPQDVIAVSYCCLTIAIRKLSLVATSFGLVPNTFADKPLLMWSPTLSIIPSKVSAFSPSGPQGSSDSALAPLATTASPASATQTYSADLETGIRLDAFDKFVASLLKNVMFLEHCAGLPPPPGEAIIDPIRLMHLASAPVFRKCMTPYERFEPSSLDIQRYKATGAVPAGLHPKFHSLLDADPEKSLRLTNMILQNPLVEHLRVFANFNEHLANGLICIFCDHDYALFLYFYAMDLVNMTCYQKRHSINCPRCMQKSGEYSNPQTLVIDSTIVPECQFVENSGMTAILRDSMMPQFGYGRSDPYQISVAAHQFWWKECIYVENRFASQI